MKALVVLVALAVVTSIANLVVSLSTRRITMQKLEDIIAELKADRDAIKAARAADAAKSDALAAQIADLKTQLADAATPDQLVALQSVADELKALGTDAPAAPPVDATPAGG